MLSSVNYRANFFALVMLTLVGCGSTVKAPFQPSEPEWALPAADSGPLSDMEHQTLNQLNPGTNSLGPMAKGHSAFKLLDRSEDALRWRLALIDSAAQSIDLQYYLYHSDNSGLLVTRRLLDAADRGVRVRIIIDDMGTLAFKPSQKKLRDAMAAVMIAHPNISLRLFNSAPNRSALGRGWDFATEFEQLNHRMHNKSLTVDNRATIVGGRNIGDEYMGLDPHFNFRDLDVLGIGPVARQTSKIFDLFWNGSWVMSPDAAAEAHAEAEFDQQKTAMDTALQSSAVLARFSLTPRDWA
ncbi:MAG: phospholipase D-like domain-containing protein, partial [Halieaceae bacterium]